MSRDCASLGICQSRKPACDGCTTQFAPGVIDGPYSRKRARSGYAAAIGKAVLAAAVLASLSLSLGLIVGYLVGGV
jgi:hypothetical protein